MGRPSTWPPGRVDDAVRCGAAAVLTYVQVGTPFELAALQLAGRVAAAADAAGSPTCARSCRRATIRSRSPPAAAARPSWARVVKTSFPQPASAIADAGRLWHPGRARGRRSARSRPVARRHVGRDGRRRGRRRVRPQRVGRARPGGDRARSRAGSSTAPAALPRDAHRCGSASSARAMSPSATTCPSSGGWRAAPRSSRSPRATASARERLPRTAGDACGYAGLRGVAARPRGRRRPRTSRRSACTPRSRWPRCEPASTSTARSRWRAGSQRPGDAATLRPSTGACWCARRASCSSRRWSTRPRLLASGAWARRARSRLARSAARRPGRGTPPIPRRSSRREGGTARRHGGVSAGRDRRADRTRGARDGAELAHPRCIRRRRRAACRVRVPVEVDDNWQLVLELREAAWPPWRPTSARRRPGRRARDPRRRRHARAQPARRLGACAAVRRGRVARDSRAARARGGAGSPARRRAAGRDGGERRRALALGRPRHPRARGDRGRAPRSRLEGASSRSREEEGRA